MSAFIFLLRSYSVFRLIIHSIFVVIVSCCSSSEKYLMLTLSIFGKNRLVFALFSFYVWIYCALNRIAKRKSLLAKCCAARKWREHSSIVVDGHQTTLFSYQIQNERTDSSLMSVRCSILSCAKTQFTISTQNKENDRLMLNA